MPHQNKHALEKILKQFVIPILVMVFFFFYAINSEPLNTPAGTFIWAMQWLLAVFIGPLLLLVELFGSTSGSSDIHLGSGSWLFKMILHIYYYGMFTFLSLALLAEWWLE